MRKTFYPSLHLAQQSVERLHITSYNEYILRYKEDPLLPSVPNLVYAEEWSDWYVFLGKKKREFYKTYTEASQAAISLGLTTYDEYKLRYKEDHYLPSKPDREYATEWVCWAEFFGAMKPVYYKTLSEASIAAMALNIRTVEEYKERHKEDRYLPPFPANTYSKGWDNWYVFLGKDKPRFYGDLEQAQSATIKLGIKSQVEYVYRYKEDPRLPSKPQDIYKKEWVNWYHFLNNTNKPEYYKSLILASQSAIKIGICSSRDYAARRKEDPRLPYYPQKTYAAEWVSWISFLGKKEVRYYESIEDASSSARKLNISSSTEYYQHYKEDCCLPRHPSKEYASAWEGWASFLGNGFYGNIEQAQNATQLLGITSSQEYARRYKEDPFLPCEPFRTYSQKWKNWYVFLNKMKPQYYSDLASCRQGVERLDIKSYTEYKQRYSEDPLLPANPESVYSEEWVNWYTLFGREKPNFYPSLSEASNATIALGITSMAEYSLLYKNDPFLPAAPQQYYSKKWVSWFDFVGKKERKFYKTLKEASLATIRLSITTMAEYKARYKEDSLLPAMPSVFYEDEWSNWYDFTGQKKQRTYTSIEESNQATVRLGITSISEYRLRYKDDPLLPKAPWKTYAEEWNDAIEFLIPKEVHTVKQFKLACKVIGIKNSVQYRKKYKEYKQLPSKPEKVIQGWSTWYEVLDILTPYPLEDLIDLIRKNNIINSIDYSRFRAASNDSRIPASPEECYRNDGWTNRYDFFGKPRPYQVNYFRQEWHLWADKIEEFLKSARGGDTKAKDLCEFVREYIEPNGMETCPLEFLRVTGTCSNRLSIG